MGYAILVLHDEILAAWFTSNQPHEEVGCCLYGALSPYFVGLNLRHIKEAGLDDRLVHTVDDLMVWHTLKCFPLANNGLVP